MSTASRAHLSGDCRRRRLATVTQPGQKPGIEVLTQCMLCLLLSRRMLPLEPCTCGPVPLIHQEAKRSSVSVMARASPLTTE